MFKKKSALAKFHQNHKSEYQPQKSEGPKTSRISRSYIFRTLAIFAIATILAGGGYLAGVSSAGNSTTGVLPETKGGTGITNLSTVFAKKDSPNFTGVPTAPTAVVGTNTTQLATTEFTLANRNVDTGWIQVTDDTVIGGYKYRKINNVVYVESTSATRNKAIWSAQGVYTSSTTFPAAYIPNSYVGIPVVTDYFKGEVTANISGNGKIRLEVISLGNYDAIDTAIYFSFSYVANGA